MSSSAHPGATGTGGPTTPTRVGGRYVLRGELGRGGMATVHRARDEVLDRDVAVKLLHAHLARDPAFLDRFRREARASAALGHPNVVTVHDWGETDDGPFLVLQLVEGPSLRAVLRRRGRLLPAEAVAVLAPAAVGLGAAHAAGLVHRDVKPENLLLGLDGTVRVTDFGLARAAASATSTFGSDVVVGSPHYLSPEAVRAEPLDPRSDVYALGVTLSELLTGRPPFEGESPFATAVQHTSRRVPPPSSIVPSVPPALDAVVARATDPDPGRRYPDGRAFARALEDAVADEGATVPGLLLDTDDVTSAPSGNGTAVLPVEAQETTVAGALAPPPTSLPGVHQDDPPLWEPIGPDDPDVDAEEVPRDVPAAAGADATVDAVPGWLAEDLAATAAHGALDEAFADEDDDEDDVVPARPRRGWLVAVLVVVALLAGSALAGYLLWDRVLAPVTTVPAVEQAELAQAAGALEDAGFRVVVADERPYSLEVDAGRVIGQDPIGDARQGATVTLSVSAGPRPVTVIDVRGDDVDGATAALEGLGLVVADEVTERYDPDVPSGALLGTDPPADETVDEGSEVTLVRSLGPQPVTVPSLTGRSLEDAQATLRDLGLEAEVAGREFSSDVPEGDVLGQSVDDGDELLPGETVGLTLSRGPAPIEVPNLRGQVLADAEAELEGLGFDVDVELRGGFGSFLSPGRVFEQEPGPGAERFRGDTITLYAYES